jgi:putative transposase
MQSAQLPACKGADPSLREVYGQVLQDVLHRVDKTYQAFFKRRAGYPRFKGKGWFDSFTYPQLGFRVQGKQPALSKIGNVRIKLHRPLERKVKTLTLKNENGNWYACFSSIVETEPLPENDAAVGIDLGLQAFATTSDRERIENPGWFRTAQKELRKKQRHVSRSKKGPKGVAQGVPAGGARAQVGFQSAQRFSTQAVSPVGQPLRADRGGRFEPPRLGGGKVSKSRT